MSEQMAQEASRIAQDELGPGQGILVQEGGNESRSEWRSPLETKKELQDRLQRERRWFDFCRRRKMFTDEGMSFEEAHGRAAEEYGPLEVVEEPDEFVPDVAPDIKRDYLWAYAHLGSMSPRDPPSQGAKIIHREAQKNRWEFIQEIKRMLAPKGEKEEALTVQGELGGLLDRLLEESKHAVKP